MSEQQIEISEYIEFSYSWTDEKGRKTVTTMRESWDGLEDKVPESPYLHGQLASFLECVGIYKPEDK